jgi:hypothetical protein
MSKPIRWVLYFRGSDQSHWRPFAGADSEAEVLSYAGQGQRDSSGEWLALPGDIDPPHSLTPKGARVYGSVRAARAAGRWRLAVQRQTPNGESHVGTARRR